MFHMATVTKTRGRARETSAITLRPKMLPKSLYAAAGLLRHKRKALEAHLRRVRRESP